MFENHHQLFQIFYRLIIHNILAYWAATWYISVLVVIQCILLFILCMTVLWAESTNHILLE